MVTWQIAQVFVARQSEEGSCCIGPLRWKDSVDMRCASAATSETKENETMMTAGTQRIKQICNECVANI